MAKYALLDGGKPVRINPGSLWDLIHSRASRYPNRPALLSPAQPADLYAGLTECYSSEEKYADSLIARVIKHAVDPWYHLSSYALSWISPPPPRKGEYLMWSFAEMKTASIRLGCYLRHRGLKPGATVVILLPVCTEWALMVSTCALNGYVIATLDDKLLDTENLEMLQEYIDELSPSLFVVAADRLVMNVAKLRNRQRAGGICLERLPMPQPAGWISMLDIAESKQSIEIDMAPAPYDAERAAIIVYTSGSSGRPKGCAIQSSQLAQNMSVINGVPLLPCTGTVVSGSAAQSRCPFHLLGAWASGNSVAVDAVALNGESLLETMQTTRPAFISLLVSQLGAIYGSLKKTEDATSSIRVVILIGSTITASSVKRAKKVFRNASIRTAFGMTEAANITTWQSNSPSHASYPTWNGIAASGKIAPGAKVKLVNEFGTIIRRNEVGEMHLSGTSVVSGYLEGAGAHMFYKEDGHIWYICGDSAVIDDNGYIYVVGRTNSIVKQASTGEAIIPASVESLLETHFASSILAVTNVGVSNGDGRLFVVFQAIVPGSCDEINELISREIGHSHRIEGVANLAELGFTSWPKSLAGKIAYSTLRVAAENFLLRKRAKPPLSNQRFGSQQY